MPHSKMEHSIPSAVKNLHHAIHNRPSTPIEIPSRRRPLVSTSSPIRRPMSPELLFEMSPIISEFPSPPTYTLGLREPREPEPFLYPFPPFPARSHPPAFRTHRPSLITLHSGVTPQTPSILSVSNTMNGCASLCRLEDDDISPIPLVSSSKTDTKTKISGMSPSTPVRSLISPSNHSPTRAWKHRVLSPPPRSSSYSSSPWILPGKSDLIEDDRASLEADPSMFDFEKHLMRRIENQNHVRFREISLNSMCG
ncbi:hypothetical protein BDZ94DRAFT_1259853 [Collybia nuda]|uniref:Uncharacterized protein n=1 Tax=Collybia nuda TaxID=64659 RepID=A0A9P5Y6A3_9AGAR|nr:hypothetical protein BDZ94DRAFT_1259853 [Collybia nuda]